MSEKDTYIYDTRKEKMRQDILEKREKLKKITDLKLEKMIEKTGEKIEDQNWDEVDILDAIWIFPEKDPRSWKIKYHIYDEKSEAPGQKKYHDIYEDEDINGIKTHRMTEERLEFYEKYKEKLEEKQQED